MFLTLNHQKLDIYQSTQQLVFECYKLSIQMPAEEKFGMISQIRRAALSVHLNLAEGSARKSELERKRFFEISRSSLVEIDAALDISNTLGYLEKIDIEPLGKELLNCFKMLTQMIKS
ncbi:MAG: four helix bundle protein [Saprospiraceae bacterium]|nr:four helix bundle protein [Saprospiraceae bacterium]